MITEDYVSFDTAKLLKEKGFNESVGFIYSENGELLKLSDFGVRYLSNSECDDYSHWQFPIESVVSIISAPTIQMAMKWLREVYNKSIEIRSQGLKATGIGWIVEIYNLINQDEEFHHPYTFLTYEEAAEAAIKYCLKNLI